MKDRHEHIGSVLGRARPLAALLVAAALGACGNVTAGGVTGEAEVYMSGDADGSGSTATALAPTTSASTSETRDPTTVSSTVLPAIVGAGLEGDVEVTASFYLRRIGDTVSELTPDGDVTVTVDLGGAQEPRVADEIVPGGSYEGVRIVFSEVVAHVTAGLEIGGLPFADTVTVDLGADGLVVDRTLAVTVSPTQSVALLVDLNSDVWLDLLDPDTKTVAAADFASAVEVTLR